MIENGITHIIKRNGQIVQFDQDRITNAIFRAYLSIGGEDMEFAKKMSDKVVVVLNQTYSEEDYPSVEEIQDVVVDVLDKEGFHKLAVSYQEYRDERARLREERESQIVVNDKVPYKILWEVYTWNVEQGCDTIDKLNKRVKDGTFPELVEEAEKKYHYDIDNLAERILRRIKDVRMIMVAGPSSSGKTTTTIKLGERLKKHGIDLVLIGLDNYFKDLESHPKDEYGDYDFERPEALDIPLINEHLSDLLKGKTIQMPVYNFKIGKRKQKGVKFYVKPNQIILIDSLHGLYKPVTASILEDYKFKLYIEALCQIKSPTGEFVRWADLRMLRRMVRDSWCRKYSPLQTVGHWHYVRRSEMKYIIPYIAQVDHIINGSLPYELPVHKKYLFKYMNEILHTFENQPKRIDALIRAQRVHKLLSATEALNDDSCIPQNSLMREFIGGSVYEY